MSEPANLLSKWAGLLLDSLADAGVTDVVISPGSRSTPFVFAAARNSRLVCHDLVDERSAGFFALGLARATGRAPLLLCTSGTAGAHYFPSLIEADQAAIPLLVLTADRPFELQGCAAPQTIDQIKLYGDHVRRFVDLGLPDGSAGALRALRRTAFQAALATRWPVPGPVHLNARAKKPLEPSQKDGPEERALTTLAAGIAEMRFAAYPPRTLPDDGGIEVIARACLSARRGLIMCGPAPITQADARAAIFDLAARTGFPLLCEAASQLRFTGVPRGAAIVCDAFDALLASERFRTGAAPDLILQFGAPPTSGAWDRYLAAHPNCARYVVARHGWNDPASNARALVFCEVGDGAKAIAALIAALQQGVPEPTEWQSRWAQANAAAWQAIDAAVSAAGEGAPRLEEAHVVRAAVASVPAGGLLALGNSLPIREVDSFCRASSVACEVLSQRGANGIDGLVSGAAGAAASGRATTLILGDVSLLHDLGGLAAARGVTVPLVVVVINNDGGRIFEQLPVASVPGAELAHWTTPHGLSFAHAAALFGHRYALVESRAGLAPALAAAQANRGCTIIEARVPPHGAAEFLAALRPKIDAAIEVEETP